MILNCFFILKSRLRRLFSPIFLAFDPEKNSLRTLSIALKDFEKINALPKHLSLLCNRFPESSLLYVELQQNNAGLHKSCSALYNQQKFERKKRKFDHIVCDEDENETLKDQVPSGTLRSTRRTEEIKTFTTTFFLRRTW